MILSRALFPPFYQYVRTDAVRRAGSSSCTRPLIYRDDLRVKTSRFSFELASEFLTLTRYPSSGPNSGLNCAANS